MSHVQIVGVKPRLYDWETDDTEYEPPTDADREQWAINEQADRLFEAGAYPDPDQLACFCKGVCVMDVPL